MKGGQKKLRLPFDVTMSVSRSGEGIELGLVVYALLLLLLEYRVCKVLFVNHFFAFNNQFLSPVAVIFPLTVGFWLYDVDDMRYQQ